MPWEQPLWLPYLQLPSESEKIHTEEGVREGTAFPSIPVVNVAVSPVSLQLLLAAPLCRQGKSTDPEVFIGIDTHPAASQSDVHSPEISGLWYLFLCLLGDGGHSQGAGLTGQLKSTTLLGPAEVPGYLRVICSR